MTTKKIADDSLMFIHGYSADSRLYRFPERQIGVWLPIPLSARLDVLTDIGEDSWAPTRRKEVLSALLLGAPADGGALKRILGRYRSAKVSDSFIPRVGEWRFLYPPKSPGPRVQLSLFEESQEPEEPPSATPGEALCSAKTYRIGMMVAWPLAGRLKVLVSIAKMAGEQTTQQELISALVLDAPAAGAALSQLLERYWHSTLKDSVIEGHEESMLTAHKGRSKRSRRFATPRPKRPAKSPPPKGPRGSRGTKITKVLAPGRLDGGTKPKVSDEQPEARFLEPDRPNRGPRRRKPK